LRKYLVITFFVLGAIGAVHAQESIKGIVNQYVKVDSVKEDYVKYDAAFNVDSFSRGDLVMLIQMTGATLTSFNQIFPNAFNLNNAGSYELLSIDNVNEAQNIIEFTAQIKNGFTSGEKIQLIKVKETANSFSIDSTVYAKPWDGETGGVVALFALEKIVLNADVKANSAGFQGAVPVQNNYTGGINNSDTVYYELSDSNRAGLKGGGALSVKSSYKDFRRGRASWGNGGGGGHGMYAGGAGGGHFGSGGSGGCQFNLNVNEDLSIPGFGLELKDAYNNTNGDLAVMGGGGGASTQNLPSRVATRGGNGGGIILMVADSLIGNNFKLSSNGETVTDTSTAGGGGGGGGGAVFLDINAFGGNFFVESKGGRGGYSNGNCTGAGGSGGGGVIYFSLNSKPSSVNTDISGGSNVQVGDLGCDPPYYGNLGGNGKLFYDLKTPLNGYYFNAVSGSDTLCEGQQPDTLYGSIPKGGNGDFTYYWQKSYNTTLWTNVGTQSDSLKYLPPVVDSTVYYRRVVVANNGSADTSKTLELFVYPLIQGDTIYGNDTICTGTMPNIVTGTEITLGGDGTYTYQWQWSNNLTDWNLEPTTFNNQPYAPGILTDTLYVRRKVMSAQVCLDFSDTLTITVLSNIQGNDLLVSEQTICQDVLPDSMQLTEPTGADPNYYEFEWLKRETTGSYTSIPFSGLKYNPGLLTDTTYYKRIVKSGINHACKDTSGEHSIFVLPVITNNQIDPLNKICAGNMPDSIPGRFPSGGNIGQYEYKWLSAIPSGGFNVVAGATDKTYIPTAIFEDTTSFKRVVFSGLNQTCKDTSAVSVLDVVPYIVNPVMAFNDTVCEHVQPNLFIGNPASGGNGILNYQWEKREVPADNSFSPITSATDSNYQSDGLNNTTHFRRKVTSDICVAYSDTFRITVFPEIQNNIIETAPVDSTCYETEITLLGTEPVGGLTADRRYAWQQTNDTTTVWVSATGTINEIDYTSPPLTDTVYYRRILYSGLSNVCIDTTPPVLVRINPLPYGDIVAFTDSICQGETVNIAWQLFGNAPWDVVVTDGSNNIEKQNVLNDSVLKVGPTIDRDYQMLDVFDVYGCEAVDTGFSNIANIDVFLVPEAQASVDTAFCGLGYTLNATYSLPSPPADGYWNTSFAHTPSTSMDNNVITGVVAGYGAGTFVWTEVNTVCTDSDTISVTFYEQPDQVSAGDNQSLDFTFNTALDASTPTAGIGVWTVISGSGTFEDDNNPQTRVTELSRYENILRWTVNNGVCETVSDTVLIYVNDLYVPKAFSPNGDGQNQRFIIEPNDGGTLELVVFNKKGTLVYQSDNYGKENNFWEGKSLNDKDLPSDTYFYILKIKETGEEKKGFVVLKR